MITRISRSSTRSLPTTGRNSIVTLYILTILDFSNVGRFGSVSAVVDGRLAVWIGYATVFESPDCRFARRESTGCDLPAIRVYQVARRGSGQAKGRRAIAEERFMQS